MNAILREHDEASVLTLEQIEVHLSYIRTDVEAANTALPVLRDKIDALSDRMDTKIDQANRDRAAGDAMLADRMDRKFDEAAARTDTRFDQQTARIDQLSEKVDKKFDALAASTDARFDQISGKADNKVDALAASMDASFDRLSEKMDKRFAEANKERADGDAALAGKIDKLAEGMLEIKGTLKGLVLFISAVSVILSGASLAHALGWF